MSKEVDLINRDPNAMNNFLQVNLKVAYFNLFRALLFGKINK